jgi:hypothetical protein
MAQSVFSEQTFNVIASAAKKSRPTKKDWIASSQELLGCAEGEEFSHESRLLSPEVHTQL